MRKIQAVLRLHFEAGLSRRQIARTQNIGYGTVTNYLHRARVAGVSWPLAPDVDEAALERLLFPETTTHTPGSQRRFAQPDYPRHPSGAQVGWHDQAAGLGGIQTNPPG